MSILVTMKSPGCNFVLVMSDAHRWDFLGCEDNGGTLTPRLDAIAAGGAMFNRAYCQAPLCCPSRQAIVSGRYPSGSGCYTNLHELPPGTPTFLSQLRSSGYDTAVIGKAHMAIHAYDSDLTSPQHAAYMRSLGWGENREISGGMMRTGIRCAYSEFLRAERMFDAVLGYHRRWHYFMDKDRTGDPLHAVHEWPFDERYDESRFVTDSAIRWLDARDGSTPFFLQVGFYQPNHPRDALPRFMDLYRNRIEPMPAGAVRTPPEDAVRSRISYRAEISQIDEYTGMLYDRLAEKNLLSNTIFIYTSDHGCTMYERYGRDGMFSGEAYANFFEPAVRVPLIICGGGTVRGLSSDALVETMDIGATVCEFAGTALHALDQGRSLVPVLSGRKTEHRDSVYAEMACDRMLIHGRYKLMRGDPLSDTRAMWNAAHLDRPSNIAPAPERLFDLADDPHETNDLLCDPAHRGTLALLRERLLVRLNENTQAQPFKSRGEYRPVR